MPWKTAFSFFFFSMLARVKNNIIGCFTWIYQRICKKLMAVVKKRNNFMLRRELFLLSVQQGGVFKGEIGHRSTEICKGFEHLIFPVKTFFPLKRKM